MKKILVAWLLALIAPFSFGQSYPSPTYNNLTVVGAFTATGKVTTADLATQAANTVLANATGASSSPTAFSIPGCSGAANALQWASGAGFACNSSINAATLGGATFAAPGPIGSGTPGSGAFTSLSASSTVSGIGFSTYLASPPAIGGTTPSTGAFTTLTANGNRVFDAGNAALDSVITFGAVSDCPSGTGTCTDNLTAFSNTITDAQTNHRSIWIPCGDYFLSAGISILNTSDSGYGNFRPNLTGAGARCVHLYFGAGSFNGITIAGTNGQNPGALSMQLISGISISKSDFLGDGFAIENMDHIHLMDVYAQQFNIGFYLQDVQESLFDNIFSEFNNQGMVALKGSFTPPNALVCNGCTIAANGQFGVDLQNPSVVSFNGGSIEENGYNGGAAWGIRAIYPAGTTDIESNTALTVQNVYFERNSGTADIFFSNGTSAPNVPSMVNLIGNNFNRAYNALGHTATISIASPAVVTFNAHGFVAGQAVTFTTTGTLPTGITAGTTYWVIAAGLTANTFEISATPGGAAVNTSGTQSGVQTVYSTALNVVQINTSNGNRTKLVMVGNGFGGLPRPGSVGTTYVPSTTTPYVAVTDSTQPTQICDIGNTYHDYQEQPQFFAGCDFADIQFDGGASPTIRRTNNIVSLTRNGVGDYTLNFAFPGAINQGNTAALPYAISYNSATAGYMTLFSYTTTTLRIQFFNFSAVATDPSNLSIRVGD